MPSRRDPVRLAALACAAFACSTRAPAEDMRRTVLRAWGEHVVLPLYADFESACARLDARARDLCAAPSEPLLAAAQADWWAARAPWKAAEVFAFGPYREEPLRSGPKIDFWPARPEAIEALLQGGQPIDVALLDSVGAAAKGLPAIEYLLYAGRPTPGAPLEPRRCELLTALTADVTRRAAELRAAWDPARGDFLGELVDAGRGSRTYLSLAAALGEVVNRLGFTVENMRADKLGRPLGLTTAGSPQPDKVESRWSGRSLADIRDNLTGIARVYFVGETPAQPGLDFLVADRARLGATMRRLLDAARAAIDAIDVPLAQAVIDRRDAVQALIDRLGELQRFIQVDVTNRLGLTVGFNDNDGD